MCLLDGLNNWEDTHKNILLAVARALCDRDCGKSWLMVGDASSFVLFDGIGRNIDWRRRTLQVYESGSKKWSWKGKDKKAFSHL